MPECNLDRKRTSKKTPQLSAVRIKVKVGAGDEKELEGGGKVLMVFVGSTLYNKIMGSEGRLITATASYSRHQTTHQPDLTNKPTPRLLKKFLKDFDGISRIAWQ